MEDIHYDEDLALSRTLKSNRAQRKRQSKTFSEALSQKDITDEELDRLLLGDTAL